MINRVLKRFGLAVLAILTIFTLSACTGFSFPTATTTVSGNTTEITTVSDVDVQLQLVYNLGLESGDIIGTYEEWLDSIRGVDGLPGKDGREVVFRIDGEFLQWQYVGDTIWIDLYSFSDLTGFESREVLGEEIESIHDEMDELRGLIDTLTVALSSANDQIAALSDMLYEANERIANFDLSSNISQTIEGVIGSVIGIKMQDDDGYYSSGSGVIYQHTGSTYFVVTNYHVVEGDGNPYVYLDDKSEVLAYIAGFDYYSDLAVIKFDSARDLVVAPFDVEEETGVGDFVLAIGSPLGISNYNTVTLGIVSGLNRDVAYGEYDEFFGELYIQHDAPISPGNSGGGLFNLAGELVGLNTLKMVDESIEGIAYAIPAYLISQVLNVIETGGYYQRPELGCDWLVNVNAIRNNPTEYPDYYVPSSIINGLYVDNPWSSFVLDLAGFQDGDIILTVNQIEIHSWQELFNAVYYRNYVDDALLFEVYRGANTIILEFNPATYMQGYYTYEIIETSLYYYIGGLFDGMRNGYGDCYWDDGSAYWGEWYLDSQDGYGIYIYTNGDIYLGDFVDGYREGYGIYIYAEGDYYEGGYKDGYRFGEGVYYWENDDYFDAYWINNNNTSNGYYHYADGTWAKKNLVNGTWVSW